MEYLLALLEFKDSDIQRRISNVARASNSITKICDRELTTDEHISLSLYLRRLNIHSFFYHEDTNFHCNQFCPPSGFAATFHQDTTFNPYIFSSTSFRGTSVCYFSIDSLTETVLNQWKDIINYFIPDISPDPPLYGHTSIKGPWSPALGTFAWINIGEKISSYPASTNEDIYYISITSGLDRRTYQHMYVEVFNQLKKKSFQTAMDILSWYRGISNENRNRILYTLITHLGLNTMCQVETSNERYNEKYITQNQLNNLIVRFPGIQNINRLHGVLDPLDAIDGVEDDKKILLDLLPKRIHPDYQIMLDDIIPYSEPDHILRLCGCCQLSGSSLIHIESPDSNILLYEAKTDGSVKTHEVLDAFPAQSDYQFEENYEPHKTKRKIITTWLGDSSTHPLLSSSIRFHNWNSMTLGKYGADLTKPIITLKPKFTRISNI